MLDAVFISDLHLNSQEPYLITRFNVFVDWALVNTRAVYVLGDLFHVWAGDDCVEAWSEDIAKQFRRLTECGIQLYFMPGNRDFLLGQSFANQAGFRLLKDPSVIMLGDQSVLLAHGDAYCLFDKAHQRFRRLTRNAWFISFFLILPSKLRQKIVGKVRAQSQRNRNKSPRIWDVVPEALVNDMRSHHLNTLIHGHIHKPGFIEHSQFDGKYGQFVLSDWDDTPQLLGYNKSTGFKFIHSFG